jgi:hypothetical protein
VRLHARFTVMELHGPTPGAASGKVCLRQATWLRQVVWDPFLYKPKLATQHRWVLHMAWQVSRTGLNQLWLHTYRNSIFSYSKRMYVCIYIYIYIYAGPFRDHQAARHIVQSLFPSPSSPSITSWQSSFPLISSHFQSSSLQLAVCQFGISF